MKYRLANKKDIDAIHKMIRDAIRRMEEHNIFQWDELYPTKDDFFRDIERKELYIGEKDNEIAVVFTVNKESDIEYNKGEWNYPESEYRVVHRLCVNPKLQNSGIARMTLEYIERILREQGVESIRLDTFCENPFSCSLYLHNGYKIVGVVQWRKGNFYLLEKSISS